jgi:hypothetical protein
VALVQFGDAGGEQPCWSADGFDGRRVDSAGDESSVGIPKPQLHAGRSALGVLWRDPAGCWGVSGDVEQYAGQSTTEKYRWVLRFIYDE